MNPISQPSSKRTVVLFLWLAFLLMILAFFSPGCTSRGDISGMVSYQGDLLTSGSVLLVASDLKPRTTRIEKDGSYKFSGVPTGEARLAVYNNLQENRVGAAIRRALAKGTLKINGKGNGGGIQIINLGNSVIEDEGNQEAPKLPENVNDPLQSGLHYDIKGGSNTYHLEIK